MRINDPDPDNQPTRDEAQLAVLRQDMGEAADDVVAAYQDSITGEFANLKASTPETPRLDVKRYAHTIKSSSLAIGAMRLAHLGARLERAVTDEADVDMDAEITAMETEFEKYLAG